VARSAGTACGGWKVLLPLLPVLLELVLAPPLLLLGVASLWSCEPVVPSQQKWCHDKSKLNSCRFFQLLAIA
jgi:hypothetical protein